MALNEMQLEAIQEDIADTRTKKERIDEQMSALSSAGKTLGELAVDATPIIGDVKAATELPEDIQLIKDLMSEGYDEGSIKKMGLGSLLGIATALGFVPAAGTLGDVTKKAIKKSVKKGSKPQPFQPEWRQKQIEQVKAKYKDSASRRQALREINKPAIKIFHGAKGMGEPINQKQYESTINDLSMYNNAYMDIPLKEIYGDADKISISDLNQSIGPKNLRFPTVVKTDSGPLVTYAVPKLRMSKSGNYAVVDLEVLDPAGDGIIDTVSNAIEVTDGKIDKSQILNLAADFEIEGVNTVFPNRDLKQSRAEQISNEGFLPYNDQISDETTFQGAAGLSGERASGQHFELKEKALSTSRDPLVSMKPSFGGRSTQNIVYSDVDPKTVRDMPSEEYTDLVTFGQADPRKQNITKGDPKYIGASLPKSAHLEAETAVTNPEMLSPKRLGTGDVTEVTQAERGVKNIGQMDLEQRVATGQRLANNITQTLDKIKLDYRINKESDVFRVDNPVLAANNVYKTTNTLLRDLQSLGNFTEQYGARGTYDSILETAAKSYGLLLNIKDAAKVLPEGEKKINLSRTSKILEEIGSLSNSASSRATTGTRGLSDDVLKKALSGKDLDKETHNTLADAGIYISNKGKDLAFDPMKIGYNDLKRMLFLQTDKFNQGGLVMNEGGAVPMKNMAKQMELFEEGGLMDEGGSVDEVSGNEVPPGSLKEEVRDDIPAQLSEGEFVFPADVVRYYGLETLMKMRQQAKAGLQRMEDMGQMGNSDEATLPDDIPFSIEDLDIEDDDEYNMAVGGYVPPMGSGIAAYQPSQFQQYQPQYTPYQPVPMQAAYQPPQAQAVPTMQPPAQLPTFEQFTQAPTGTAPENREYINPTTGERRIFTFISGNPTTAIPEGFIPISEYTEPEPVTTTPTVGQTRVAEPGDGGRDDERRRREEEMYGPGGGRLAIGGQTYGVSFDMPSGFMPGAIGAATTAFGLLTGRGISEGAIANLQRGEDKYSMTGSDYNKLKDAISEYGARSSQVEEAFNQGVKNYADLVERAVVDSGIERKGQSLEEGLKEAMEKTNQSRASLVRGAELRRDIEEHNAQVAAEAAKKREQQQVAQVSEEDEYETPTPVSRPSGEGGSVAERQQAQREAQSFTERAVSDVAGRVASRRGFSKGGDVTKQMKRGGLASKK